MTGGARLVAWLRASRLASQSYIALPLLLGQALHAARGGGFDRGLVVVLALFGLLDQLHVVYTNDVADEEGDRRNETPTIFSGGSRQLVDGTLRAEDLRRAAVATAVALFGVSLVVALVWARPLAPLFTLVGLALPWAYSHPPIRLSYRGGGEALQAIGVGFALPLFGFYAASGQLDLPGTLVVALVVSQLACAIATSLPDEVADRAVGKRTLTVWVGAATARTLVVGLGLAGPAVLLATGWFPDRALAWVAVPIGASLAALGCGPSPPGSRALTVRVFLAVLSTLALEAAITLELALR